MAIWSEALNRANDSLKMFYTVDSTVKQLQTDLGTLRNEYRDLLIDHQKLAVRVAALEEARATIQAELRAVVAEAQASFEKAQASAVADVRVQAAKESAELYRKYLDAQVASGTYRLTSERIDSNENDTD